MSYQLLYSPEEEEVFFDRIDQVYELIASSKFEEAEELLLTIEGSIPDPKENCSVGAIILDSIFSFYEQIGQVEKALPYFLKETTYLQEKIETQDTENIGHFVTTGSIYYAMQDLDEARVFFKKAFHLGNKHVFQDLNSDFLHMALISDEEFEIFKQDFIPGTDPEQEYLSDEQQDLIDNYCEKGNLEMDEENYIQAINWFNKALAVLPVPAENWEAAGWIYASIGDGFFCAKKYKEALDQLITAQHIYGDEDANPFVLLRLGETYFELGDHKSATVHLLNAYHMEGPELFEDDKKYLNFLKRQQKL